MLGDHFFEEVSEDSIHPNFGEHLFTTHPSGEKRVGALPKFGCRTLHKRPLGGERVVREAVHHGGRGFIHVVVLHKNPESCISTAYRRYAVRWLALGTSERPLWNAPSHARTFL